MSVERGSAPVITKRDGSSEPFSSSKLRRCVEALLRGAGFDPHLATPLSKAVALHVERCDDEAPLTASYVFDCVHAVLSQTGLREAADGFQAHREERRRSRARISLCDDMGGSRSVVPWDKACLIATLIGKYGLRQTVSRYLASEIERKMIGLDYQSVSRELVTALTRNELSAWGLLGDSFADPCGAAAGRPENGPQSEED